jgi:hypothetical protein
LSDSYRDPFFNLLNIIDSKNKVFTPMPSEIPEYMSFDYKPDKVYLLDNNVILDLEFDSSGETKDLPRYMLYVAHLAYTHTVKSKSDAVYSVRTVVVYPDTVKIPASIFTDKGSLLYSIEQISLGSVINGSEVKYWLK